jgi:DNA-binding XRE family transcriptional regulator
MMHDLRTLMTPIHFRFAKAALRLTDKEVSAATGIHRNTLHAVETGQASDKILRTLRSYFEDQGVRFVSTDDDQETGVIFRPPNERPD